MANKLYKSFKSALLSGVNFDWANDTFKVGLIESGDYAFDENHQFLSDVPAVLLEANLTAVSQVENSVGANPVSVANSLFGRTVSSLILYRDSGDPATSELIAFFDTGAGLPLFLQGSDVSINWPESGARIFTL